MEESHRRTTKQENDVPHLRSSFNPAGEIDDPRPELPCKVFQCGHEIMGGPHSTTTMNELRLVLAFIEKVTQCHLNREPLPQIYITKPDGSKVLITVSVKWNDVSNRLDELHISYPVKDVGGGANHFSMVHMFSEMLNMTPPDLDVESVLARLRVMEQENTALKSQLAT